MATPFDVLEGLMNRYYVEITCQLRDVPRNELENLFEPLAEAVYDLHDVIDADLGASFADGLFDFTMTVTATSDPEALAKALSAVRAAIHQVGGATPGWEQHFEAIQHVVRPEHPLAHS